MKKTHGTRYSYNTGCRCRECRNANNTYMARYRRERRNSTTQYAPRSARLWAPWEDMLVTDYTKSARQIAVMLERTPSAVTDRRRTLNARRKNQ